MDDRLSTLRLRHPEEDERVRFWAMIVGGPRVILHFNRWKLSVDVTISLEDVDTIIELLKDVKKLYRWQVRKGIWKE